MSGGSYNYLGFKDADELINHTEELNEMEMRLIELGYHDAAFATRTIIKRMEEYFEWLNASKDCLRDIWLAVEWYDSGDSGIEKVENAIKKYRRGGLD